MKTKTFLKLPEERQIVILDASASIFAAKGYFQASVAEICEAAEMSNGALYKYFKNKRGLYIAVASRMMDLMLGISEQLDLENLSFYEKLRRIFEAVVPFVNNYRDYFVVYMDLGSPSMDPFAEDLSDQFEGQTADFFAALIDQAKSDGEIDSAIPTDSATYLLDNHMMLFAFSCVSEHYDRRFHQYFETRRVNERIDAEKKIEIMLDSFHQFLGKK